MKNIQIYTLDKCPYCFNAKRLLTSKGVDFEEIRVNNDDNLMNELSKKSGVATVPQIYVDGKFIGGCDDLYMLERQNRLDELLK